MTVIIFNLIPAVFRNWILPTSAIDIGLFNELRQSSAWYDHRRGEIGEDECFKQLAAQECVPVADVATAFRRKMHALVQNDGMIATIRELRAKHPSVEVYAVSGMSSKDWQDLRREGFDWSLFHRVFPSHGMRGLRLYRHVLDETGTAADRAVLVDGDPDNLVLASSLGLSAITFDDTANVRRKLWRFLGVLTQNGERWLERQGNGVRSETDNGADVRDNLSQLLIYDVTRVESRLNLDNSDRTWNSLSGRRRDVCPDDVDTTSLAFLLLKLDAAVVDSVLDDMISLQTTPDGIVKLHYGTVRARIDSVACVNVVRIFYARGRGADPALQRTKAWIQDVLRFRAYHNGTRYCQQADVFLYFFARLLLENPNTFVSWNAEDLLRERLRERINCAADAMGLAMRVLACHYMGIHNHLEYERLLDMQHEDGSFGIGWLWWMRPHGKPLEKVGNRLLTAALAAQAVQAVEASRSTDRRP